MTQEIADVEDHEVGAWITLGIVIIVFLPVAWRTVCLLRSNDYVERREHWAAVRLVCLLLALGGVIAVPGLMKEVVKLLPGQKGGYPWLGFWLSGWATIYFGAYLEKTYHALLGTLIMIAYMFFIQTLMPGGAGEIERDIFPFGGPLFPGGYSIPATMLLGMAFAYGVQYSQWDSTTKGFCLALFSDMLLSFMNPNRQADKEEFYAPLINVRGDVNWQGPPMQTLYTIVCAAGLGIFTLPIVLPCRASSRSGISAQIQVATWYREIAVDTMITLKHLLDRLAQPHKEMGVQKFDANALARDIKKLGERRTKADKLIVSADWEVLGRSKQRQHMVELRRFSALLRDMRQVLRLLLEQCSNAKTEELDVLRQSDAAAHLQNFQEHCGQTFQAMVQETSSKASSRLEEVMAMVNQADKSLVKALEVLQKAAHEDPARDPSLAMAIMDNLRAWPIAATRVMKVRPAASDNPQKSPDHWHIWQHLHDLAPDQKCCATDRHLNALRNLTSWTVALFWCVYRRNYASGSLLNVSFLFSPSVGSVRKVTIDRMVGVALGLVGGNLPAVLLSYEAGGKKLPRFEDMPAYVASYFVLMATLLLLSVPGFMNSKTEMKSTYSLWTGFMHSTQLIHLMNEYVDKVNDLSSSLFMTVMDNLCACLILLIVDMLYARFVTGLTVERASMQLASAFEDVSNLVEVVASGSFDEVHEPITKLDWHIKQARYWDEEVQKEDPLWMTTTSYDVDFMHDLLDQLDIIYVAARTIGSSLQRLDVGQEQVNPLLSPALGKLAKLYATSLQALLLGGNRRLQMVRRSTEGIRRNHTVMLSSDGEEGRKLRRSQTTADGVIAALAELLTAHAEVDESFDEVTSQMAPSRAESVTGKAALLALIRAAATFNLAMERSHVVLHSFAEAKGKAESWDAAVAPEGDERAFPHANEAATVVGKDLEP